ncbi:MAG: hypothetical protein PHN38_08345 [Sulfurospirillaceae bacterium]|nr:hypothetical protein [Sulfurospirillaceae bacterium]MDD3463797.1 hypothetical protein [Sulfurospirillaceae bacterium]
MRFLAFLLFVMSCLLGVVYWLLFTQSGNGILKPYVEAELSKRVGKDVVLEVFTLRNDFLDIAVLVDKKAKVVVNGEIDLLNRKFDVKYDVKAQNIKTNFMEIVGNFDISGEARGGINNFLVNGLGEAFKSNIKFVASVKDKKLQRLKLDSNGVRMEEVLSVLNKPIYSKGIVDIQADIEIVDSLNYKGDATCKVLFGVLNPDVIEKEFGVSSANINYKGEFKAKIDNTILKGEGAIYSSVMNIFLKNSAFDLDSNVFFTQYKLSLPDFRVFEPMIGVKLIGKADVEGSLKHDSKTLEIEANADTFGGKIEAKMQNNQANIIAQNIQLSQLFALFGEPSYAQGSIGGNATFENLDKQVSYKADFALEDGVASAQTIGKLTSLRLPPSMPFSATASAESMGNVINIKSSIQSNVLEVSTADTVFVPQTQKVEGAYVGMARDLGIFSDIVGADMQGSTHFKGDFAKEAQSLHVRSELDIADGKTEVVLNDKSLHVDSKGLSAQGICGIFGVPEVFSANANMRLDYDLSKQIGSFDVSALDGKILKSEMTDLVATFTAFDLTQEVFKTSNLKGDIENKNVDFSLSMEGLQSHINIPKGYLNLENSQVDAPFDLAIKKMDLQGKIKGDLHAPKVNIESSEYLKDKVEKEIEKHVPEKYKEPLQNLLKLF